jgi:phosphoserine phosphatase
MVGLKREVAAITAQAMRGELEYDVSLERRVALLNGLEESALQRVYDERLKLTPGAEALLKRTQALGIRTLLVSGGFTYMTDRLKTRLGLDHCHSNILEISDGKLTGKVLGAIVNADGKRAALLRVRDDLGITRDQIIGIGDGANDLKFMAESGVSVAYHAKPVVREKATHAINYVHLDGVLHLFN